MKRYEVKLIGSDAPISVVDAIDKEHAAEKACEDSYHSDALWWQPPASGKIECDVRDWDSDLVEDWQHVTVECRQTWTFRGICS